MHITETWHGKPCGIKVLGAKRTRAPIPIPFALEVFKIINKQTPVYLHDLVTIKKSSYSFRYNNTVNIPRVNTTRYGLHSLRYGAAKLWNELPNDLREGISLNNFKNLISKWDGDGCSCSFCS
jgi:hypothetical protein